MIELIIRVAYRDKQAALGHADEVKLEDKTATDPQVIKDLRDKGYKVDEDEGKKLTAADQSQI